MGLTLLEAAKQETNLYRRGIVNMWAQSSDILRVMPFMDIPGGVYRYSREEALPGIAFRGINQSYTASTGVVNPVNEPLLIGGGDLDVDTYIVKTQGEDQRTVHEAMKIRALAHKITYAFLKGDNVSDPTSPDGLQARLIGNQLIVAGSTANGTPLSLAKLDEVIDAVIGDNKKLIMNKTMRRLLSAAARTSTIGGYIQWRQDEFGRQVAFYNDCEILIADEDDTGTQILPFTEAASSGTATATSIYCAAFGDMGVQGIQNGGMDVRDLGELQTQPVFRTRVEWFLGWAVMHGKSAARLWSISNATVTA